MVEIRLHGELARRHGKVWHMDIESPAEAIRALRSQCKGFLNTIRELTSKGLVFRVRTKSHDYGNEDLAMTVGRNQRIDFIPIVHGAAAGVRFVVGAVLVASTFLPGSPTFGNPIAQSIGISLMMGSVIEWLTPVPTPSRGNTAMESWTMSGATNTAQEGAVIPVVYGEVVTGGVPVSIAITAAQVSKSGSIAPTVDIGGNTTLSSSINIEMHPINFGIPTVTATFGASTFNLIDPITYSWSVTGLPAGVTAVVTGNLTATLKVVLSINSEALYHDVANNLLVTSDLTFSVSVSATGKASTDGAAPVNHTISSTETIYLKLVGYEPPVRGS